MGKIGIYVMPALNSAACSILSSYTLVSILDHERWMKEWGEDHEAEAVMHLRTPMLSAAIAMGIGGITTAHQVALSALHMEGEIGEIQFGANILCTCLAAATGVTTIFAMVYVVRKDTFADAGRVDRLKLVVLKRYSIADLKLKKGLGAKVAYMGQLQHIVFAGITLALGILGCWVLNVMGLTGEFVIVWRISGIVFLTVYLLVTSIVSCWLLFRVLVWRPAHEYLRPLCSVFFAISIWSVDLFGKTIAINVEYAEDGTRRAGLGWSMEASRDGGEWLMLLNALGAVVTQYAIALELRVAYCGLQDVNLDLQMLSGAGDLEEIRRKSSAILNNSRKSSAILHNSRRIKNTGPGQICTQSGSRSPAGRRSVVVHVAALSSFVSLNSPGSPTSRAAPRGSTNGEGLAHSDMFEMGSKPSSAPSSKGQVHKKFVWCILRTGWGVIPSRVPSKFDLGPRAHGVRSTVVPACKFRKRRRRHSS